MRRVRAFRFLLYALGALLAGWFLWPSPYEWYGEKFVEFHVAVGDEDDGAPVPDAAVRLVPPTPLKGTSISGSTGPNGAEVKLWTEFRAFGGFTGLRGWQEVIYDGWYIEVKAAGYRPFVAPLADRDHKRSGDDYSFLLEQPVKGRVDCTVLLRKAPAQGPEIEAQEH